MIRIAQISEKENILKKFTQLISLIALSGLVLTACIPVSGAAGLPTLAQAPTPQPGLTQVSAREAQVESVEIQFLPADPVQVNAIVRG